MKNSHIIQYRRSIDAITGLLLFFILFLLVLFAYLVKVDSDVEKYGIYHDTMNRLELLDKSFDNFLLQKASFINYDEINGYIDEFEEEIAFLDKKTSHTLFNADYLIFLSAVKNKYYLKRESLELFKSRNASLLNSVHYLFDLNRVIRKNKILDERTVSLVNQSLLLLMKFYINSYVDIKELNKNITFLQKVAKESNVLELEMFLIHVIRNIEHIKMLVSVEKMVSEPHLHNSLLTLHHFLDRSYQKNLFIQKSITGALFVMAFVILWVLLLMHRHSLRIKDELTGFKTAVENSDNSIVITDADSNITYVNDVFERESGYTKAEAMGQNPRILKSNEAPQSFYDNLHETLQKGEKWEGEFVNKHKDGSLFYEKASITPIFIHGKLVNYLAIKLNITEYIKKQREVKYLAYHDTLTSLPNRMNIEEYLTHRLLVAQRSNERIALLFIDLDRFKIINDTLGHDVGDELLVQSALRMKQALRESDMLARVGGDEFVVVIEPISDDYSAAQVGQKLLDLFKVPIQTTYHSLNITLSIGIASYPDDGDNYNTILKHADVAMYQAKAIGRNTYAYYKKQLSIDVHNRLNLEQALKKSLSDNEIYVVYQPKYNISNKEIVGFEALVRWESEKLGSVSPDEFIPVAEEMGLVLDIGAHVFRTACEDFLEFQKNCTTLSVIAINVSPVQLYQKDIVNSFISIANEVGLDIHFIVLEITEGHIMKNIEYGMRVLNEFKDAGFSISIDDFGTGHSSMSYLKRFPIDELKIDKSFVDDLPDDSNNVSITQAIIALSKSLGYVNVAEGIENEEQEEFLMQNGCELGQGYYFCRPQSRDDMIQILREKEGNE